jgi:photosystem II stability/assembly factor-like uncharacterized protein
MPAMSSSGTWCAVVCLALATATTTTHAARMQDNFFGVDTVDGDHAWVVGNFGAVWATSDGGATWVAQKAGTLVPLFDVDFADTTHGWIVGKGGLILHTTDGGRRWTPQPSPVAGGKHFFCVKAIDADTAWAVGDWGAVASTTDGGATWRDRSLGLLTVVPGPNVSAHDTTMTDVILYDVEFIDARHGAIAGEFGTVMLTDDGGETWRRTATGTDKTLFGVTLTSPTEAWAVGIDGIILHTIDAGTSWQVQHGVVERSDIGELSFTETVDRDPRELRHRRRRHGRALHERRRRPVVEAARAARQEQAGVDARRHPRRRPRLSGRGRGVHGDGRRSRGRGFETRGARAEGQLRGDGCTFGATSRATSSSSCGIASSSRA